MPAKLRGRNRDEARGDEPNIERRSAKALAMLARIGVASLPTVGDGPRAQGSVVGEIAFGER